VLAAASVLQAQVSGLVSPELLIQMCAPPDLHARPGCAGRGSDPACSSKREQAFRQAFRRCRGGDGPAGVTRYT